jgi:hypothetical protein
MDDLVVLGSRDLYGLVMFYFGGDGSSILMIPLCKASEAGGVSE